MDFIGSKHKSNSCDFLSRYETHFGRYLGTIVQQQFPLNVHALGLWFFRHNPLIRPLSLPILCSSVSAYLHALSGRIRFDWIFTIIDTQYLWTIPFKMTEFRELHLQCWWYCESLSFGTVTHIIFDADIQWSLPATMVPCDVCMWW